MLHWLVNADDNLQGEIQRNHIFHCSIFIEDFRRFSLLMYASDAYTRAIGASLISNSSSSIDVSFLPAIDPVIKLQISVCFSVFIFYCWINQKLVGRFYELRYENSIGVPDYRSKYIRDECGLYSDRGHNDRVKYWLMIGYMSQIVLKLARFLPHCEIPAANQLQVLLTILITLENAHNCEVQEDRAKFVNIYYSPKWIGIYTSWARWLTPSKTKFRRKARVSERLLLF